MKERRSEEKKDRRGKSGLLGMNLGIRGTVVVVVGRLWVRGLGQILWELSSGGERHYEEWRGLDDRKGGGDGEENDVTHWGGSLKEESLGQWKILSAGKGLSYSF